MRNLPKILLLLFLSSKHLSAQNADLNFINSAGKYHGLGGAGVAIAKSTDAFDLNPAGLAASAGTAFSLTQNLRYYGYSLFRTNMGMGAIVFDWFRLRYALQNAAAVLPLGKKTTLAAGFLEKLDPFVGNYRRATTWSSLFRQTTAGRVNALAAAAGLRLSESLSIGMTVYRYFGSITSVVQGENHGQDDNKWARLKNSLSGWSLKLGSQWRFGSIHLGADVELPYSLDVKAVGQLSSDQLYKNYLPDYRHTHWRRPPATVFGFGYTGIRNLLLTVDYELHGKSSSNLQLNVFEFGGRPNWKKSRVFRAGCEIRIDGLPLRIGYAYIPQQYASNISAGQRNAVLSYNNTDQNVQSLFTAGTEVAIRRVELMLALNYGIIHWQRDLATTWLIRDEFTERRLAVVLGIKKMIP